MHQAQIRLRDGIVFVQTGLLGELDADAGEAGAIGSRGGPVAAVDDRDQRREADGALRIVERFP